MGRPSELEEGSGSDSAGLGPQGVQAARLGLHLWLGFHLQSKQPDLRSQSKLCQVVRKDRFVQKSWSGFQCQILACTQDMQARRHLPNAVISVIAADTSNTITCPGISGNESYHPAANGHATSSGRGFEFDSASAPSRNGPSGTIHQCLNTAGLPCRVNLPHGCIQMWRNAADAVHSQPGAMVVQGSLTDWSPAAAWL